jgi:hypothetical protein
MAEGNKMRKVYCQYCGELLENSCDCERELAEEREQFIEDYENSPETQYGWAQQDLIDTRRREQ